MGTNDTQPKNLYRNNILLRYIGVERALQHKKTIEDRIMELLEANHGKSLNTYSISRILKLKQNTTRATLSRMIKKDKIKKQGSFYRCKLDLEDIRSELNNIRLHGIKIEANCCEMGGRVLSATNFKTQQNRKIWSLIWNGRQVTITQHDTGLIEIWIKCSKSSLNLSHDDFENFINFIDGLTYHNKLKNMRLRQIGINCDMRRLQLKGIQHIKLQEFRNAWAAIYKKGDQTRIEYHLVLDMPLDDAMRVIHSVIKPRPKEIKEVENGCMEYIR